MASAWRTFSAGLALGCAAPATAQSKDQYIEPSPKEMQRLQLLTPEGVAASVTIKDDDLERIAVLDSAKAYSSNGRFTDRVRTDNFVRALIDKSTGRVTFQVYQNIRYAGDARGFVSVNFATDQGPISAPLQSISHNIPTCAYGLCVHDEDVGFLVPENVLRQISMSYRAGASQPWRFRLKAQNGIDWEDRIMPAEAAGLLLAVDRYNAARRGEGRTN